ncbi:MAG: N(G),N(G)-dimethylarginine dimethylaminohydrolase [Chloroflexota bacterium]|nr:N(G),N(G)-dimethylarginine dimethylaminohydrolase [Chloroflexota bacterium]
MPAEQSIVMNGPTHAFVRPPGDSYEKALGQAPDAEPIDINRARAQHSLYLDALRASAIEVTVLAEAEQWPDSCFVQDVALLLPALSILSRPAEPSRQGEVDLIRPYLPVRNPVVEISAPGTLEWGDVLILDQNLVVGLSARTNQAGSEQLRQFVVPLGLTVETLTVPEGLHLLSGINSLGRAPGQDDGPFVVVAWPLYADLAQIRGADIIVTPDDESGAANCLALGDTVIVPAGFPRTATAIWRRGFRVLTVPIGEFAKSDGGVTCLSLLS